MTVPESVRLPESSLAPGYIHKDSYMSRVPGRKTTNQRALQVLARIESKLAGEWCRHGSETLLMRRQGTKGRNSL